MTLLIIFICAAFAVTALYFAIAPFLASREDQARAELLDEELKLVEHLVARKTMLLHSLRELEFEHETQKIADEDYERFRAKLERQAVGVMRELDRIHGGRGWQDDIDAEVKARLAAEGFEPDASDDADAEAAVTSANPASDDAASTDDAASAGNGDEVIESEPSDVLPESDGDASPACAKCGEPLEDDDKFCSQCGHPVSQTPALVANEESAVKEVSA